MYVPIVSYRITNSLNFSVIQHSNTCRPVESHSGARESIISRGPCAEIETPNVPRGRKRGEGCPLAIRLGVRGSVVSSSSGVRAEPRPKMDFVHI